MKDYISVYDNAIDSKVCDDLVKFFEDNIEHTFTEQKEHRKFRELNLQIFPEKEVEVTNLIVPYIDRYKKDNDISDYVWPSSYRLEYTRFKKYLPNTDDRFEIHADATQKNTCKRFLVMFVYLSDNESGHTSFPNRDIKIQPKKGRLLMFPPNWCYPHVGEKVFDKPKYILGTYCEYVA